MSGSTNAVSYRCGVCGYVHASDSPPDICPVCGAATTDFEPWAEPVSSTTPVKSSKWQCINCDYVHEGAEPPDACPVCGAEKDKFAPAREAEVATSAVAIRVVIVGGGVAGVSAAETIRKASPDSEITLICVESELPYYRLNLTRYLAGEITRDSLPLHPESWYVEQRITLLRGTSVEKLSIAAKLVTLADGRELIYDKLILTTGSHPYIPPLPGTTLDGVLTLRIAADADRILEGVGKGSRVVCVGGGILGLETAGALAARGADITLLESHGWLMPRQLNQKAGGVLERHVRSLGVKIEKNAKTKEIVGAARVTAVSLQDGRSIPADIVLLTTGVRPNSSLARKTGFEVNNGIIVDNHMRASAADVFAAGDVAEHNGQLYGSWAASQYQGGIAGLNAVGVPTSFGGLPRSNTVKALGLDLTSVGTFQPEDGSYLVYEEETERSYLEFVFRDGKLRGAIVIGRSELAAPAKKAVESGTDFTAFLNSSPSCGDVAMRLQSC